MSFFLLLIIILIVFVVALPITIIRHIINLFSGRRDGSGNQNFYNPFRSAHSAHEEPEPAPKRKKVFDSSDGEYVDFEELPGEPEPPQNITYKVEEQVSDAEWVEIKKS